jgi:Na+-transporting NADH:ubiquinone oxidoreductase subunit NqrF
VVYTLTQEQEKTRWQGEYGRISPELLQKYVKNFDDVCFYLVGASTMISEMKSMLMRLGVHEEKIQVEDFPGY